MRIENTIVKDVFFDNYGQRRFISATFNTSYYTQNWPAFAFPLDDEPIIRQKFKDIFNFDSFNEQKSFDGVVIENGQTVWAMVNNFGQILSLESMYYQNDQFDKEIIKCFSKLDSDYPGVSDWIAKEDKINAIVALYLLENQEHEMAEVCKIYYQKLLLKADLSKNLDNNNSDKTKTKI